jgi:hypothetical protein
MLAEHRDAAAARQLERGFADHLGPLMRSRRASGRLRRSRSETSALTTGGDCTRARPVRLRRHLGRVGVKSVSSPLAAGASPIEYEFVPGPDNHRDASVICSPVGFACRADERPRDGIARQGRNPNPEPDCVESVGSLARDGSRAVLTRSRPDRRNSRSPRRPRELPGCSKGDRRGKVCRPSTLELCRRLHARYGVSVVGWTDGRSGRNGEGG